MYGWCRIGAPFVALQVTQVSGMTGWHRVLPLTVMATSVNVVLDNAKTLGVIAVVGTVGSVTNQAAVTASETIAVLGLQVQYQGGLLVECVGSVAVAFVCAAGIVLWLWWIEYAQVGWMLRWLPFLRRPDPIQGVRNVRADNGRAAGVPEAGRTMMVVAPSAKERVGAALLKETGRRARLTETALISQELALASQAGVIRSQTKQIDAMMIELNRLRKAGALERGAIALGAHLVGRGPIALLDGPRPVDGNRSPGESGPSGEGRGGRQGVLDLPARAPVGQKSVAVQTVASGPLTTGVDLAAAEAEAGYGRLVSLGDARATVAAVCRLIRGAGPGEPILLAAFTFDHEDVAAAVLDMRQKGQEVYLLVDAGSHAAHQTRNQSVTIVRLSSHGVKVRFAEGESLEPLCGDRYSNKAGSFHAKFVLVGDGMVAGSTNWTRAAGANRELSVVLRLSLSQGCWARHYFWRAWDEARGAHPALAPKGDVGRPEQGRRGHYGAERWRSSADPAPYGHDDCDIPHLPAGRMVADDWGARNDQQEHSGLGSPWPQASGAYLRAGEAVQPAGWGHQVPAVLPPDAFLDQRPALFGRSNSASGTTGCRWCGHFRAFHTEESCRRRVCVHCLQNHFVRACPMLGPPAVGGPYSQMD